MPAWTLDWNDLSPEHKKRITDEADYWACPCCGNAGDMAVNMFATVIKVIEARDKSEIAATLGVKT